LTEWRSILGMQRSIPSTSLSNWLFTVTQSFDALGVGTSK
jgi:hypothetical protein